jgi:hypothetical protein
MTKQKRSKKNTSLKRNIRIQSAPNLNNGQAHANNPFFPNMNTQPPIPLKKKYVGFNGFLDYLHDHILFLNNSKFFAGVIMILLNIGSKFISVQFSKSSEEYLKYSISKQILVFAMSWMATRDIYTSLILTAVFVVLSEFLFNEESTFCIVPQKYRVLEKLIDTNNDGIVSESELHSAIQVLEKAKKEKQMKKSNSASGGNNQNANTGGNIVGVQGNTGILSNKLDAPTNPNNLTNPTN